MVWGEIDRTQLTRAIIKSLVEDAAAPPLQGVHDGCEDGPLLALLVGAVSEACRYVWCYQRDSNCAVSDTNEMLQRLGLPATRQPGLLDKITNALTAIRDQILLSEEPADWSEGIKRTLALTAEARQRRGRESDGTRIKPPPRRGTRAANIEKLEKELEKHLLAARDHAHSCREREPALLPRPTQKDLARWTGLTQSDVSRCLNDPRAKVLKILWDTANSLEAVMKYNRR